jgi:hypothetical protein
MDSQLDKSFDILGNIHTDPAPAQTFCQADKCCCLKNYIWANLLIKLLVVFAASIYFSISL